MRRTIIFALLLLTLAACSRGGSVAQPAPDVTVVNADSGYPAPTDSAAAYPPPGQGEVGVSELPVVPDPYSAPNPDAPTRTPLLLPNQPFSMEPIAPGATEVVGTGPAELPLRLVNVSLGGELIADGRIGADGRYTFTLPQPLEANTRIGIELGSLDGSPYAGQEAQVELDAHLLLGEGSVDSPVVGLIVASQTVE